jgi:hypothetical protein
MHMTKTLSSTAIVLGLAGAVLVGAALPAGAHCGTAPREPGHDAHAPTVATSIVARRPIPHPTGPGDVVIHIEHSPNGWGAEYAEGSTVTVYGDGRIVIVPPSGPGSDGPPLPEATVLRVTEDGIQKVLRAARRAGLLQSTDFGEPGVTDQGTSVIDVTTTGEPRTTSVYALLLEEGDRGLTRTQRANRAALRDFAGRAADPDFYERTLSTT